MEFQKFEKPLSTIKNFLLIQLPNNFVKVFIRYNAVGLLIVGQFYLLLYIMTEIFNYDKFISYLITNSLTVITHFCLHARITFKKHIFDDRSELFKYIYLYLLMLAFLYIVGAITVYLFEQFINNIYISTFASILINYFISYLGLSKWIFKTLD